MWPDFFLFLSLQSNLVLRPRESSDTLFTAQDHLPRGDIAQSKLILPVAHTNQDCVPQMFPQSRLMDATLYY